MIETEGPGMEFNGKMMESMNDPNAHRPPGAPMNDTWSLSGESRYSDYQDVLTPIQLVEKFSKFQNFSFSELHKS